MYRKPLLTPEDAEPLIGKVTRLEFFENSAFDDWVGIVTGVHGSGRTRRTRRYIYFTRANGDNDRMLFIGGTCVVFATTADSFIPADQEEPFRQVRWDDRDTLG